MTGLWLAWRTSGAERSTAAKREERILLLVFFVQQLHAALLIISAALHCHQTALSFGTTFLNHTSVFLHTSTALPAPHCITWVSVKHSNISKYSIQRYLLLFVRCALLVMVFLTFLFSSRMLCFLFGATHCFFTQEESWHSSAAGKTLSGLSISYNPTSKDPNYHYKLVFSWRLYFSQLMLIFENQLPPEFILKWNKIFMDFPALYI